MTQKAYDVRNPGKPGIYSIGYAGDNWFRKWDGQTWFESDRKSVVGAVSKTLRDRGLAESAWRPELTCGLVADLEGNLVQFRQMRRMGDPAWVNEETQVQLDLFE